MNDAIRGKFTLYEDCSWGNKHQAGYKNDEVSSLVLDRNKYRTDEDFNAAVGNAITLLLKGDYELKVNSEQDGLVAIEFSHDNNLEYFGGATLYWLDEDESDCIDSMRKDQVETLLARIAAPVDANDTNEDSNE